VIRSFKGNLARMILDERRIPKGFPTSFAKIARRKLIQLNNADDLGDLARPAGQSLRSSKWQPCRQIFNSHQRPMADRFSVDQRWTRGSRD
jgi:toxin HigB-1